MDTARPILPQIFIVSLSSLAYELTLTRIFSISLWYHFAFMVISIAMLGIAASGTLLSVYPKLKDTRYIQSYILLFCISVPASYLLMNITPFDPGKLSWDRLQILYLGLYYIILSFPFFSLRYDHLIRAFVYDRFLRPYLRCGPDWRRHRISSGALVIILRRA